MSNHLGNVLVTISDKKIGHTTDGTTVDYFNPEVVTANDYYPGGMLMPGRKYQQGTASYRYSINGQEKERELNENITTAEFWEYDSRIVRRWNIDPKPNISISPYNCFAGNPIRFSDMYGDSVILGNLYDKDAKGNYKNTNEISAFELFAKTKDGEKYILDHAQQGFKLKGVFISGLDIEAKSEGSESKKGVDVTLGIVPNGYVREKTGYPGYAMTDDYKVGNGRLKLSFHVEKDDQIQSLGNPLESRDAMLRHVDDFAHEFFLHGDLQEKKFLQNSIVKWDSHSNSSFLASKYGGENKGRYSNSSGLKVLQQVQLLKLVWNQGLRPHSQEYLYQRIMASGLNQSILDFQLAGYKTPSY